MESKRERRKIGAALKEQGQNLVMFNERERWKSDIAQILNALIKRGKPFDADDLKHHAARYKISNPHHPNCWGAVMGQAAKKKQIKRIGIVQSATPSRHACMIGKWIGA